MRVPGDAFPLSETFPAFSAGRVNDLADEWSELSDRLIHRDIEDTDERHRFMNLLMAALGDAIRKNQELENSNQELERANLELERNNRELLRTRDILTARTLHLHALTLQDELTGLYNRRGLFTLAAHHSRVSRRQGSAIRMIYLDVDGLKKINDSFGHSEGDRALRQTAAIMRKTFRESDILARIGGDEFAVFMTEDVEASECDHSLRLRDNLREYNERCSDLPYRLSFSLGTVRFQPSEVDDIEEMLLEADRLMYENKRRRGSATI